jgi:glycosyltransferase involved in cell wall biosynthesis
MRIVIDMQGAQTESRFRGIGRYTMSFAKAVVRNRGDHEIILALSGLFPDTIEPIRASFNELLPQENIRVWYAPGPVREEQPGNESRREVAELIREAFLASLKPDVVHICSMFEGYVDNAVTSIGRFDTTTPVSVILYDLIPLLNPDHYLKPNPRYEQYYSGKVKHLNRANKYLSISEFSREEGLDALNVADDKIINISTAIDADFKPEKVDESAAQQLRQKFNIILPFVLYTGGSDERKNLPRLIQSWSKLPSEVREKHQLLFAGRMSEGDIVRFKHIAHSAGLKKNELIFTGYVSDEELVKLYNLCKLYVFPSWHEGFGLPALEAMACGAPVIGANASSLPEVIGLDEALFDPFDVKAICSKLAKALTDNAFRKRLQKHSLKQAPKFSWDETAKRAISAWGGISQPQPNENKYLTHTLSYNRLVNALVEHCPTSDELNCVALSDCLGRNQQSGIERQLFLDVSELCQHDAATGVQRVVRSYLKWLLQSPPEGFRVEPVYATRDEGYRYAHAFTCRFLGLDVPEASDDLIRWQRGDIFFGLDMQHHVQLAQKDFYRKLRTEGVTVKFLVHDLLPIQLPDLFPSGNIRTIHEQWLTMIAYTDGAICVSKATSDAYEAWIKQTSAKKNQNFHTCWVHNGADITTPKSRTVMSDNNPHVLRSLRERPTFLCVSTIEPRKKQKQILEAVEQLWNDNIDINLVFVGQQGWKVEFLAQRILEHSEAGKRLFWLKGISDEYLKEVYSASTCLIAASLNEGFGLPLIEAASHCIPILARDIPVFREVAGDYAYYFSGETAGDLSSALIAWLEQFEQSKHPQPHAMQWSTWQESTEKLKSALVEENHPRRQLMIDISELVQSDARTGVHRVVKNILSEWLKNPPAGYRVEPVYATVDHGYKYARGFNNLDFHSYLIDVPIDYSPGDIFFGLDLNHHNPRVHRDFLMKMYAHGVDVLFMVYDILPIQFPDFWEPQHSVHVVVEEWLTVLTSLGGVICISKAVANELNAWVEKNGPLRQRSFTISWFHLGADMDNASPSEGLPLNAKEILKKLHHRNSFLMVGTLEPRKGHTQVLDAFEQLWQTEKNVNLVIVGKQGWMVDELVQRTRSHPELNKRLFWLEGISDEYLEKVYAACTCLIAASYGEGFGLPLIEAAQHKLPIIARDIPVFREVAGEYAYYFDGKEPDALAEAVKEWTILYKNDEHPKSDSMPWLTWKQSAEQLLEIILPKDERNKCAK